MSAKALLILGLTGSLGVAALAYYVKVEPGADKVPKALTRQDLDEPPALRSVRRRKVDTDDDATSANRTDVSVYVPRIEGSTAFLKNEAVSVPAGQDPMEYVAQACVKEADVEGVKVIGVELRNRVAVVNFGKSIEDGMGSEQEGSFLKALQVSFGQFKNVDKVEIESEGQSVTSLGNVELSGPIEVVRQGDSPDRSSTPSAP